MPIGDVLDPHGLVDPMRRGRAVGHDQGSDCKRCCGRQRNYAPADKRAREPGHVASEHYQPTRTRYDAPRLARTCWLNIVLSIKNGFSILRSHRLKAVYRPTISRL